MNIQPDANHRVTVARPLISDIQPTLEQKYLSIMVILFNLI